MRSGCKGHLQASKRLKHVENDLQLAGKQEADVFDINNLLTELADSRKVFHSEADFQHALAWHIHQTMPESKIRLEFPMPVEHRKMHVDIWLPEEKVAIELKYATQSLELKHNRESFALRDHRAQNQRRYDFLQDIHRLELMRSMPEFCEAGHAVLLTNDPLYWNCPRRKTMDSDFRVHEGREVSEELAWDPCASPGMVKGRESPILLTGSYCLHWQDYSDISEEPPGKFRYLAVSVK